LKLTWPFQGLSSWLTGASFFGSCPIGGNGIDGNNAERVIAVLNAIREHLVTATQVSSNIYRALLYTYPNHLNIIY
jgi:hypothetical protein